jgi:hypothetical protein
MLYAYVRQKPQDSFFVVQILALREKYFFSGEHFFWSKIFGKKYSSCLWQKFKLSPLCCLPRFVLQIRNNFQRFPQENGK